MSRDITRKAFVQFGTAALAASSFGFPSILIPRNKEKLGVALVGLGNYSTSRLAPGLQQTEHCELRGIVTGSPEKIPVWQERHEIPDSNVYSYETMHELADNDDIDIVYIVLPPSMHAEYSIIGAEAGKHVWCEKPMAMTVDECQSIIDAARRNGVNLSIGYRMQHEPNTQTIIRYGEEQTFGPVRQVRSGAGFRGNHEEGNWRIDAAMGGGALFDMGVYCINGARYATGMEPVAVSGIMRHLRDRYKDVDEYTVFELVFPDGVTASCETSFGEGTNYLDIDAANGWYRLRPFQSYSGVQGTTSRGTELPPDPAHQQARQMDSDALAIKESRSPLVPGEEGLADIHIVEAIFESSRQGGVRIEL